MPVPERELRARLHDDDDAVVEATLREAFHPVPRGGPLLVDLCPRADLLVEPDEAAGFGEEITGRMLALANEAQQRLRRRRFERRLRRKPSWPVVVCEGDSWVAHPFAHDITDHLLDEGRYSLNVYSTGAAGDRLVHMAVARDYAEPLRQQPAAAFIVSGGGNDMLVGFASVLSVERRGDPVRQLLEILESHMDAATCTLRALVAGVHELAPSVPVVVHGYDYLRPGPKGKGHFLSPFFDHMGIDSHERRLGIVRSLVDRFNEDLMALAARDERVRYVNLRDAVPDDEWTDEIHPNRRGFGRLAARIARELPGPP